MRTVLLTMVLLGSNLLNAQAKGDKLTPAQIAEMRKNGTGSMTMIISTPSGADVILDGRTILRTPARFVMEKKGDAARTLVISMGGYKPFEQKVEVKGQTIMLNVKLEALDSPNPSTASNAAPGTPAGALPTPVELKPYPEGVQPYDIKGVKLGALLTEWNNRTRQTAPVNFFQIQRTRKRLTGPLSARIPFT